MLKILSIDNISARAFRLVAPTRLGVVAFAPPRVVERETAAGRCDASLLPVACLESLAHLVEPVGEFGIACTGPVASVLLLTRMEPEVLLRHRIPIGVTTESCTSRLLVSTLFRMEFGRDPQLVESGGSPHAQLVIGDEALKRGASLDENWQAIDLCAWWYRLTGQPFVFARWTVRHGLSVAERDRVVDWLESNVCLSEYPSDARLRFGAENMPFENVAAAQTYYARLRNRLVPADLRSIQYFKAICKEQTQCTLIA